MPLICSSYRFNKGESFWEPRVEREEEVDGEGADVAVALVAVRPVMSTSGDDGSATSWAPARR